MLMLGFELSLKSTIQGMNIKCVCRRPKENKISLLRFVFLPYSGLPGCSIQT